MLSTIVMNPTSKKNRMSNTEGSRQSNGNIITQIRKVLTELSLPSLNIFRKEKSQKPRSKTMEFGCQTLMVLAKAWEKL